MSDRQPAPTDLDLARKRALEWLREAHRNPSFIAGQPDDAPAEFDRQLIERFLSWVGPAGFTHTVHERGPSAFEVHWKYRGSELVGFVQPRLARTADEATLLGAAALLQNEWCRTRLP